jgi:hypothetical protein
MSLSHFINTGIVSPEYPLDLGDGGGGGGGGGGVTPEPSAFLIWSILGGLGIAIGWWRKRKAA